MRSWIALALVPAAAAAPLRLSLKRAVELALSPEGSAQVQLAGESLKQAQARSAQSRAALLPNVDGYVNGQSFTRNLEAMGISVNVPIPGFRFPTMVGPIGIYDARATASQAVFDFSAIRRLQASRAGVGASREEVAAAEEQVAARVAKTYVRVLRADATVAAVKANIELAQAVLEQARNQKTAGTGTGIEITRARVQLSDERQRLLVAENERRRAGLELLRAMNAPLDIDVELTDTLRYVPVDTAAVEQARAVAAKVRPDVKAQEQREQTARLVAGASRMERLPSLAAFADYGSIGTGLSNALPTRTVGLSLRIPVFDGGRRDARRAETASQYRQEQTRTADLKQQVELDIRLALDSLESAGEQIKVAEEGLALAQSELTQAQRRYAAGVAAGIEVTDAQTRVSRARDNQVAALFQYNIARIDLAQATGTVRRVVE